MSRDKAWPLRYNETIKEIFHPNVKILNLYDLLSIILCKGFHFSLFSMLLKRDFFMPHNGQKSVVKN